MNDKKKINMEWMTDEYLVKEFGIEGDEHSLRGAREAIIAAMEMVKSLLFQIKEENFEENFGELRVSTKDWNDVAERYAKRIENFIALKAAEDKQDRKGE